MKGKSQVKFILICLDIYGTLVATTATSCLFLLFITFSSFVSACPFQDDKITKLVRVRRDASETSKPSGAKLPKVDLTTAIPLEKEAGSLKNNTQDSLNRTISSLPDKVLPKSTPSRRKTPKLKTDGPGFLSRIASTVAQEFDKVSKGAV